MIIKVSLPEIDQIVSERESSLISSLELIIILFISFSSILKTDYLVAYLLCIFLFKK